MSVLYGAVIIAVFEDGNKIVGVRVARCGKITDYGCKMLIDGTSEGHVIRMCNVNTYFGRERDGQTQPFTSVRVFVNSNGVMGRTNSDSGYINQYDDKELSRAIIAAHSSHVTSFDSDETFLYTAPLIGVREGLRFLGEHMLTLDEVLDRKEFDDVLMYSYSDIDRHGSDYAFDDTTYQEWHMASNLSTVNVKIPVPVRCIIPKGKTGIISTGRCISMDSYVAAAVRMNRDMYRLGEACGVLAAMAVKTAGDARKIDHDTLVKNLVERKCYENSQSRPDYGFSLGDQKFDPVVWLDDVAEIKARLSTDCPAVAIWSCRRLGKEKIGEELADLMKSDDEMLSLNAAVALGITGDSRALPLLRKIVRDRKVFFYKDCRRTNQLRSAIAVYLCGKLNDNEIVPELLDMLTPQEFERDMYHELTEYSYKFSVVPGFNGVYFQHLSNAVAALVKIAHSEPALKSEIRERLYEFKEDESYLQRITDQPKHSSYYKMAYRVKEYIEKNI